MKNLIFRITLPLTIVSFEIATKWWYGLAIDSKDVFFYGFPLIYKCEGFHTSMSTQYFLTEMIVNFGAYFVFWITITVVINRFWKINIPKRVSKIFWVGFGLLFSGFLYISNNLDDRYLIKREFDIKIFDSGFAFFQNHSKDREKYHTQISN